MQNILANHSASITELKKSPTSLLNKAGNEAIAILNHNIPSAYLVPSPLYEKMMEIIDDYHLSKEVEEVLKSNEKPVRVNINDLNN
ncbi:MAG: antitoxin [Proteobacteria bacterium]|nr:MAG: antitoxin [Pseudomonadota bacterium]